MLGFDLATPDAQNTGEHQLPLIQWGCQGSFLDPQRSTSLTCQPKWL